MHSDKRAGTVIIHAKGGLSIVKNTATIVIDQRSCRCGFLLSRVKWTLVLSLCYVTEPSWRWGAALLM